MLKTELPQLAAVAGDALVTTLGQDICLGTSFMTVTLPGLYSQESRPWHGPTDAQEEGTRTRQKWGESSLRAEFKYPPEVFCLLGVRVNGACWLVLEKEIGGHTVCRCSLATQKRGLVYIYKAK